MRSESLRGVMVSKIAVRNLTPSNIEPDLGVTSDRPSQNDKNMYLVSPILVASPHKARMRKQQRRIEHIPHSHGALQARYLRDVSKR